MTGSTMRSWSSPGGATMLESFAGFLLAMTSITPPRASARQMLAFCIVARANIRNESINLADLMTAGGDDGDGKAILGRSIERTFGLFMEPTRQNPDGLGWVTQELDPDDRRKKYLKLTERGWEAVATITEGTWRAS